MSGFAIVRVACAHCGASHVGLMMDGWFASHVCGVEPVIEPTEPAPYATAFDVPRRFTAPISPRSGTASVVA
jgi:hypothetical protein